MKVTHLKFLFLMIAVFVCGTISAQTRVKGTVVDEEGLPIVGATVMATPSKVGTITDMDGKFDLSTKSGDKSLNVSFIGYATEVVKIAPTVKVVLKSDATEMDEVIVVAYGSAKKSSFTGSASVVKADKLEKFSGTGFTDALQGMTAGVNVTADANNPGAEARIAIRGVTNMAGNTTPLYVVDGVPYDGSLNSINPNDI
ncbi:MAG: carboxypeptidase-like regulatory domain-containing protein [Bacteroidaceae bacterium]|nr:carboxypeptidase-like regulatory domain-containing protein [Bacteroidaceae bacterium]